MSGYGWCFPFQEQIHLTPNKAGKKPPGPSFHLLFLQELIVQEMGSSTPSRAQVGIVPGLDGMVEYNLDSQEEGTVLQRTKRQQIVVSCVGRKRVKTAIPQKLSEYIFNDANGCFTFGKIPVQVRNKEGNCLEVTLYVFLMFGT